MGVVIIKIRWLISVLCCAFVILSNASEKNAETMNSRIGRGINLGNALEAPKEGAWGVQLKEEYFDLIKGAGFDSVRIPCCWSAHAENKPPYRIESKFLKRVDWAIEQVLSRDMVAIVNVHHYSEFMDAPQEHKDRLLGIWKQLAEHYRDQPWLLCFEVLNEPTNKVSPSDWNGIQNEAIALIRKSHPDRIIFVAPIGWNRIDQLHLLELPAADRNLIASVHYYEPFKFTHQGAGWVTVDVPIGTKWLGTDVEKASVRDHFDVAMHWSKENKIPINVGEFGAYNKADLESRVRWMTFLRSEMELRNISWNYWEFCSGFGVYDSAECAWRAGLLRALIPGKINPLPELND